MAWYEIVLGAILLVVALVITIVVLLQEGRRAGIAGAIGGGAETFLSKNQAHKLSNRLRSYTKYLAIFFGILAVAVNLILWLR